MASEEDAHTRTYLLKRGDSDAEQLPRTKMSNLTRHLMNSTPSASPSPNPSFPQFIDGNNSNSNHITNSNVNSNSEGLRLDQPSLLQYLRNPLASVAQFGLFPSYGSSYSIPGHTLNSNSNSNSNVYRSATSFQQPVLVPSTSNYIPSTHNTPTMVTLLYLLNHLYSLLQFVPQYKPANLSQGNPTTTLLMELASPAPASYKNFHLYLSFSEPQHPHHLLFQPPQGPPQGPPLAQSLLTLALTLLQSQPHNLQGGQQGLSDNDHPYSSMRRHPSTSDTTFRASEELLQADVASMETSESESANYFDYHTEPDHYMTYKEFLENLNKKDNEAAQSAGTGVPEEHLNITEYPINDLILMLSCLLTKIVEANDKLHPNHFDNTIAMRQRQKEEKRLRRAQKQKIKKDEGVVTDNDETFGDGYESGDEEDEMKNKYLANVLAFHGKNVPGISLHAYLTRVLKYCPVTSDVFLSLLVYFDRIAKKANNLRKQRKENNHSTDSQLDSSNNNHESDINSTGELGGQNDKIPEEVSEQLFVMDSYNIHRLIILGITVSSKFFLDIFYKNLRYAKVGGLPLEELNYLELQFLLLLDFKLMISVEDLQNYGDLLLRFWKREQVTSELVNSTGTVPTESIPAST